jgi:hypothetical protein
MPLSMIGASAAPIRPTAEVLKFPKRYAAGLEMSLSRRLLFQAGTLKFPQSDWSNSRAIEAAEAVIDFNRSAASLVGLGSVPRTAIRYA